MSIQTEMRPVSSTPATYLSVSAIPQLRWLRPSFYLCALVLGMLHAFDGRNQMNPDGISYLDIGDAYWRGDWTAAINGYWSPLYSWLLGLANVVASPSLYWEFPVVHAVNLGIFLVSAVCFDFFLTQLVCYNRLRSIVASRESTICLPDWAWPLMGYPIFLLSSLQLIGLAVVTPDLTVCALVLLAAGVLLRIHGGHRTWHTYALLGLVLGLAYLTKAVLFPLAFVFLAVSVPGLRPLRQTIQHLLVGLVVFLLVSGPFVTALSVEKGRLTFGDSALLNYAWYVAGVRQFVHWQGGTLRNGVPSHPSRRVLDTPEVFEFATPVSGTYPVWYDPTYWNEGVVARFDPLGQAKAIAKAINLYYQFTWQFFSALVMGGAILFSMSRREWSTLANMRRNFFLLVPAIAPFVLYSLVHVETRFLGGFVVLFWAAIFSSIRLPDIQWSRRLAECVSVILAIVLMGTIVNSDIPLFENAARDIVRGHYSTPDTQVQIAEGIQRAGVQPGDKVGVIGYGFGAFWARLARVKIVAELPSEEVEKFAFADQSVRDQVIHSFFKSGAKVAVTENRYASEPGWKRIGKTDYSLFDTANGSGTAIQKR